MGARTRRRGTLPYVLERDQILRIGLCVDLNEGQ